jgi:hypothetical protein
MDWDKEDGLKQRVARQGATMILQVNTEDWQGLFRDDSFMETLLQLKGPQQG